MKAFKKLKSGVFNLLDRPGLRPVLVILAAFIATVRMRKLCTVSYQGEWVQKFPSCTLVEPRITLWTPEQIEKLSFDLWMYRYLPKEGDTIVDVGAGTGWETLHFSRSVGRSGRVISIEAHPNTFRCLAKMCEQNRLENVTLVQAAVVAQEGKVQLSENSEHEGNRITTAGSGVPVAGTTLDSISRSCGLAQVDLLKMNIEGAEGPALAGMREMVRKTKNVCISCHDFLADEGEPSELRTRVDVIAFLKQNGFAVLVRDSDRRCNVRDFVYGVNEKLLTENERDSRPSVY